MNQELPDVQAGFRKGIGTRDQTANICWIIEKAREFQKKAYISALLTMPKPLIVWITINCKILEEMGIPDHLTCLLRNLYAGQEATVRTGHGTDSEKVGLKLNIQKTKIMASGPITSWEIDVEIVETVSDFILGAPNHCRW